MRNYEKVVAQVQRVRQQVQAETGRHPALQIYMTEAFHSLIAKERTINDYALTYIDGAAVHIVSDKNHPEFLVVQKVKQVDLY